MGEMDLSFLRSDRLISLCGYFKCRFCGAVSSALKQGDGRC
jgi:hypothetical protein